MSSTDIKLPTSGSLNWGGGLNRYLENLNLEVANLQRLLAQKKENYHLVGYAGSGMVGECDIEYSASSHKVSFSGNVYLSGEEAYYKEDLEVESSELSETPYPVFVFLKADIVTSGEDQGEYEWNIVTSNLFQIDYHYILLGVFYRSSNSKVESFIPYYFSSAKTLAQHRYELINRWGDLNKNLTSLTVTIDNKVPSILSTDLDWTGDFILYCGGLGHDNEPTTLLNPTGSYTVSRKHTVVKDGSSTYENKDIDIILFQDGVEGESGSIITSKISSWNSGDFNSDKSVYFRILLDIFGNIIIQKSLDDLSFSTQRQWSEQQLYNARFASLESSVVSGDNKYSWEAGLPIEVARFGYNCKDIDNLVYKQNNHTPGLADFNFVKALNAGVAYQQAQNIYITQDSGIWTDKIYFKKNGLDLNSFTIDYLAKPNYHKIFENRISCKIEEGSEEVTTTSTYYINQDDISSIQFWSNDLLRYVIDVSFYNASTLKTNKIIKSFTTKNARDKIKLWRSKYNNGTLEEKTITGTIEELYAKQTSYPFIVLDETEYPAVLGISIVANDDGTYSVTLGKCLEEGFSEDESFVVDKMRDKSNHSFSITPFNQNQRIYFDFTTTDRNPSRVLWCQTKVTEGIDLTSGSSVSINSGSYLTMESGDYFILKTDNFINISSKDSISLKGTKDINISSDKALKIVAYNGLSLKNSNDESKQGDFLIETQRERSLNITTSRLYLSNDLYVGNDLYVENELSFGTEGFITLPSDKRLKTDIKDINYSFLDIVNRTPVLSFKYKGGKDAFVGLMAQDLQNNLPAEFKNVFVKTHKTDQYKDQLCLTETKLVYVLWKALQEEVKNNEKLKEEICEIKKYLKL